MRRSGSSLSGRTHSFVGQVRSVFSQKACECTYTRVMVDQSFGAETRHGDAARWQHLIAQLDPAQLTNALLPLVGAVPGYEASPIPRSEIRRTAELSFVGIIAGLKDGELGEAITVADEIGASRARAEVPLSALMSAVRLDFTVLWEQLVALSEPADAPLIVQHTGAVLRIVDAWVAQVQRAYLGETRRIADEASAGHRDAIAALFQDPPPTHERLAALSVQLGFAPGEGLTILAALDAEIPALHAALAELRRSGGIAHTHHLNGALIAVVRDDIAGAALRERAIAELRVGLLREPEGPRALRHSAGIARELALCAEPGEAGAMTWGRGWARYVARALQAEGTEIVADVRSALATCTPAKRARLLETVGDFLSTGSIGLTSERLFSHRNTVSKHLSEFRALTGVDPTVPREAARLVIGWPA